MPYLILFGHFFYIGLFAFGGGFAIIPFLQNLIDSYPDLSADDLSTIIALAEITPGAVGVNMATYTGYVLHHVWGSLIATFGLICPALIIVSTIAGFWQKIRRLAWFDSIFNAVKSAVIGLLSFVFLTLFLGIFQKNADPVFNMAHMLLFLILCFITLRFKLNPIYYIIGMGVIGAVIG